MTRTRILTVTFAVLLPLYGCNSSTQPPPKTAPPSVQPAPAVSNDAREEAERFRREVEAEKRKAKPDNTYGSKANRNYIP